MALLTIKTEFNNLQNRLGDMYKIAKLSFQSTPPPASSVWNAGFNASTKLLDSRNQVVSASNFHNNTFSGSILVYTGVGNTAFYTSTPTDLYAGEVIYPSLNPGNIGTVATTGLGTTSFFVTSGFFAQSYGDTFTIVNPSQPSHYDASITLEGAVRLVEKTVNTIPTTSFNGVTIALNNFYTSVAGMSMKNFFDQLRTGTGMTNNDWNNDFRDLWYLTRNEEVVVKIGYWKSLTGGPTYSFISTTPPSPNDALRIAQGLRLRVIPTTPVYLTSYTLATLSGTQVTRTLSTPVIFPSGITTTYNLDSGISNYISLVAIGATSTSANDVIEIYNI